MDPPSPDSESSKKKKKAESANRSSFRKSFKWFLERGSKKKSSSRSFGDDQDEVEGPFVSESPRDPDASGLDLFVQSPSSSRPPRPNNEGFSDIASRRDLEDDEVVRSTASRKRVATRTLSLSSSDSEVESNHLCGTAKRKNSEKGKGKKKKIRGEGERREKENRRKEKEAALQQLRDEFSSDDDEEIDKVFRQFHKSSSGNALASTSGVHASSSRDNVRTQTDENQEDRPMELDDDDDDEDDATIMVVKRGRRKSGGRTESTWPRPNEGPSASASSLSPIAGPSNGGIAATHPRARSNIRQYPPISGGESRGMIKSPSQKSGVGNSSNGASSSSGNVGSGDVEVRVRTTARGTSVSVLLPSGGGGSETNSSSARSASSRDVRSGGSQHSSQTNTLQRRRHFNVGGGEGRRNSLPVSAHHSVQAPPQSGYSAAASSPDMTEDPLQHPPRRTSVIQIDDDDDDDDDEDEPVVEFERVSSNRSEDRSFPDVLEEPDDESREAGGAAGPSHSMSPDAVGVINQIDDDARLARQLQEEFDREMASSMAREMEQTSRGGVGARPGSDDAGLLPSNFASMFRDEPQRDTDDENVSFFQDGERILGSPPPGAPGPYYDLVSRRRRLSRVLASASSHVGAVSRAPPARRRAGGGIGALPLELSLGFGFGAPLGGVIGGDVDSDDVQAILDANDDDMDDETNESSNDSDVLFEGSQRGVRSRGAPFIAFESGGGGFPSAYEAASRASRFAASLRRPERRAASSSSSAVARRGPQQPSSVHRGERSVSIPSVRDEERDQDDEETQPGNEETQPGNEEGEGQSQQNISVNNVSETSSSGASQAPRRSRRLQRGPTSGLLSAIGGSSRSIANNSMLGPGTSLSTSSPLSTSLNDIVGIPLQRITATAQLSTSSTSVDRGPVAPSAASGPRGLLRGRLARAAMTSSTPALNTLGHTATATSLASRGPRPLSTSRSPTSRGPRSRARRPRALSESIDAESTQDTAGTSGDASAGLNNGERSSVSCTACEAIQSRIQTYLEEVRTLQDTPVEGYDANFERMRVTTQLMRQTNDAMREWRNHTSQAPHHSLEERSHRLNTMSAIYRQISEIIQGAVRGLSPGTPLSSSRSRSRTSRSSRDNAPSTSTASSSSRSTSTRGQRYPGDATNPQFQFRRPRAPSHLAPRLFIGQLPPGRLIPLAANGWPADFDYETLLRLGDIMGDVVPQGLSQTQINRLPTHIFNAEKQKATSSTSSSSVGEREDHKQCHVCLTEYDNGEQLRILPCFHRFHSACIDEWIKTNPTCPLCRVRVEFDD